MDPHHEPENNEMEIGAESDDEKKTGDKKGRRKIKIELIEDKSRRHITFSKRKLGIMKKVRRFAKRRVTGPKLETRAKKGHHRQTHFRALAIWQEPLVGQT
jgi:hypothetical protein